MQKFRRFNDLWARAQWIRNYGNYQRPGVIGINPTLRIATMNEVLKFEDNNESKAFDFLLPAAHALFKALQGIQVEEGCAWVQEREFETAYSQMSQAIHRLEGYRKR